MLAVERGARSCPARAADTPKREGAKNDHLKDRTNWMNSLHLSFPDLQAVYLERSKVLFLSSRSEAEKAVSSKLSALKSSQETSKT